MPSLRHSVSSPALRSMPYPASSRSSRNRRVASSSSSTSTRRVLADIDWWRVVDGQEQQDQENGDQARADRGDLNGDELLSSSFERVRLGAAHLVLRDVTPEPSVDAVASVPSTPEREASTPPSSPECSPSTRPSHPRRSASEFSDVCLPSPQLRLFDDSPLFGDVRLSECF